MKKALIAAATSIILFSAIPPHCAHAYIGPGAGIGAIGTVLTLIGAVLLAILGFVWYPIKRLIAKIRGAKKKDKSS